VKFSEHSVNAEGIDLEHARYNVGFDAVWELDLWEVPA
jgi:hypothetical protein